MSTTSLMVVETIPPLQLFKQGAMDPILDRIIAEARSHKPDISTEKGRKEIASLAYKVSRTKTYIEEKRKELVADHKKFLADIDAEGRRVRQVLDDLRDEVRRPLTEYEQAEADRAAQHEQALDTLKQLALLDDQVSVSRVQEAMAELTSAYESRSWQEFSQRAKEAYETAMRSLKQQLQLADAREAEAAAANQRRIEDLRACLHNLSDCANHEASEPAFELKQAREKLEEEYRGYDWQEFAEEARQQYDASRKILDAAIQEATAREQKLHDEEVARKAREKAEAEAAERELIAKEQHDKQVAELERKRVQGHENAIRQILSMKPLGDDVSSSAIQQRIDFVEGFQRDWEEFADKANQAKLETIDFLKKALKDSREREQKAEEARATQQREADRAEEERREKNRKHRMKIHAEILAALSKVCDLTDVEAKVVLAAVGQQKIPHLKIQY